MSEALSQACSRVLMLFGRNEARDALDRYAVGCVIRDVRGAEHTYGQNGVGKIARAIGRDVDTLYEYADVAETWSEVEISRLLQRKTPAGLPLSFTHLVVLSKLRHRRDVLKVLTDRALTGLSARHLRALVDEERRGKNADSTDGRSLARLKQLVTCTDRLLTLSRSLDEFLSELQSAPPTDKVAELLQQARRAYQTLNQICTENAERLGAERARVCSLLGNSEEMDVSETSAA